ncbi:hypothetical protein, partial [Ensifer sp. Root954]|uniref:hypothetical protein n=1 Tax=Ensifer sp. Root954 TaxID=1736611 RepID=UPI00138F2A4F
ISVSCDENSVKLASEDQTLSGNLSKAKAPPAPIEEAIFGLSISRKIGHPEQAVGTSVLMALDASGGRCTATTAQLAHSLRMGEQHVIGALRSMQGKGLLRIVIEPDVAAMARLGDDYRAAKRRLHEREA